MIGPMSLDWAEGAFDRAVMRPMPEPTWESILALPNGTEVLCLFVAPFGIALRGMQFYMDESNHTKLEALRDDPKTSLPTYVTYVLPQFEVPDPEEFFLDHRKDADNQ